MVSRCNHHLHITSRMEPRVTSLAKCMVFTCINEHVQCGRRRVHRDLWLHLIGLPPSSGIRWNVEAGFQLERADRRHGQLEKFQTLLPTLRNPGAVVSNDMVKIWSIFASRSTDLVRMQNVKWLKNSPPNCPAPKSSITGIGRTWSLGRT